MLAPVHTDSTEFSPDSERAEEFVWALAEHGVLGLLTYITVLAKANSPAWSVNWEESEAMEYELWNIRKLEPSVLCIANVGFKATFQACGPLPVIIPQIC